MACILDSGSSACFGETSRTNNRFTLLNRSSHGVKLTSSRTSPVYLNTYRPNRSVLSQSVRFSDTATEAGVRCRLLVS
ncbi:hypothetical protein IQ06DRAFT_294077 [Phaeosphaeriaceae sp. SRC1lsM3a]|nr:hypothetical protein IQ06DRAFT_294077 [Stagonospora sp. SRC1lsM3a]